MVRRRRVVRSEDVGQVADFIEDDNDAPCPPPIDLPFSLAEVEDIDLSSLDSKMKRLHSEAFYSGSYTALFYHSLCRHSRNTFWESYKRWFEIARKGATVIIQPDVPGTAPSGMGSPASQYGASHDHYREWPNGPHVKSLRQWAMTNAHFLLWVRDESSWHQVDRDWAGDALHWINKNIFERFGTCYGYLGAGGLSIVKQAAAKEMKGALRSGYWGSQAALIISSMLLSDRINKENTPRWLNVARRKYSKHGLGTWQDAYAAWEVSTKQTPIGELLWDIGNPNINERFGWGLPGEHKAPGTGHASRYIYLAQMVYDLTADRKDTTLRGLAKTFSKRICRPLHAVTGDGEMRGKHAYVQQFANYIDGYDGPFRLSMRGMKNKHGSNEGMEGFVYQGWYLGAVYEERGMDALTNLFNQIQRGGKPPFETGTYKRHSSVYGQVGVYANLLDVNRRRRELRGES